MTGMDSKAERRLAARTAETRWDYLAAADWSHVTVLASTSHRPAVTEYGESGMVQVSLSSQGANISVVLFPEQARELLTALASALAGDGAA